MEAIRISPQQAEMYDFERNFAQWQQRYQAYQRLLADFRQRQEGFAYQKDASNNDGVILRIGE